MADCSIWVPELARAPDSPAGFLVHRRQGTRDGLHLAEVSLRPGDWSRLDLGGAA